MTAAVEGFSHRFFGVERLRGICRRKYLTMFDHCCDLLCFIVDGASVKTIRDSYDSYYEAYMSLPVPTGVIVVIVDSQELQTKVKNGSVTIPANSMFNGDGSKPFIGVVESVFKQVLSRKNFMGKYFFESFESSGSVTVFECIIKRARDFVLALRQDRILDITS